ncbi:hypothetical protein KYC5002_13030 [Archangium violaceum]|uniref:hypothetical protein n=1 Tax=Archangium violaceum TaxID=83451 RepID=UPI002B3022E2|nr:hypothetical protein KYC5002_13030 [Archangium gephyra]
MSAHRAAAVLLALLLSTGCPSAPTPDGDDTEDASVSPDASVADGGETDGGETDAGEDGGSGSDAGPTGPFVQPTLVTYPSIPLEALSGVALEGLRGTWEEEDFLSFSYQWLRCSTAGGFKCSPIPEAILPVYVPTVTDEGYQLMLRVTATNILGAVQAPSNVSLVVRPPGPINTVAPALSGTARVGGVLTVNTGTWTGAAGATYTTAWLRCEETTLVCSPIPGETGSTYTLTSADLGSRIRARVTATTSEGSVPVRTAPSEPIGHPACATLQTTAAQFAGTVANVAGSVAWTRPELAGTLDGMAASAGPLLPGERTQRLVMSGFGFELPPGGVVQGIELELVGWSSAGAGVHLERVVLDSPLGPVERTGMPEVWGTEPRTLRLGGSADTWEQSWRPEDISSPEFKVVVTVRHDGPGGADTVHVDGVRLTVHYQSRSSVGPVYATLVSQGSVEGRVAWENPSAAGPDDAQAATLTLAPQQQSQPLQFTGFGLPLPAGKVPRGVKVEFEASGSRNSWLAQFRPFYLVHGGVLLTDPSSAGGNSWLDELGYVEFGGALDSWRAPPLTHDQVTAPTFGAGMELFNISSAQSVTLGLHSVRMTAYYDVVVARSVRTAATASSESNTLTWQNPNNIKARDGALASVPGLSGDGASEQLTATGFGFALPPTAIVHGVQVTVRRLTLSGSDTLRDSTVRLVSGGGPVGGNRALGTTWKLPATDVQYGGSSDLWGRAWKVEEVNDPSFGVALAVRYAVVSGNDHPRVDSVQMAVSYCVP